MCVNLDDLIYKFLYNLLKLQLGLCLGVDLHAYHFPKNHTFSFHTYEILK